ncbi:type IV pilin N-terminal domain-containing protein [Methanoregula sp.]|uniref:type IV pilin N-terminal domain-containing protein n=1 Tax=Methanoregula sp. TaxID=2052170 RepID=UPI002637920F|nr:type IV pilin N-terminal domain-containing protein [Methanoregula sp.]MDD5143461.1 type IV pilin N-terminal domain-containing protein [Methanoregula sp.]
MKTDNHSGASEVLGAVILIAVIGTVVSIAGVAILSQPPPEKIPALHAEIKLLGNTVMITHNGGDALQEDQMKIMVDG